MKKIYRNLKDNNLLNEDIARGFEEIMGFSSDSNSNGDVRYQDTSLESEKAIIKEKYSSLVQEPREFWNRKPVKEFFKAYKPEITEMLKEYPKVSIDEVLLLEGMTEGEIPFVKEFIETKILQELTGAQVILLPKYSDKLLNNIFGLNLREGSFPDGLVALVEDGYYVEYKAITESNLIRRLNKSTLADKAFIAIDNLSSEMMRKLISPHTQLNLSDGFKTYILNETTGECWILTNKKQGASYRPPCWSPGA